MEKPIKRFVVYMLKSYLKKMQKAEADGKFTTTFVLKDNGANKLLDDYMKYEFGNPNCEGIQLSKAQKSIQIWDEKVRNTKATHVAHQLESEHSAAREHRSLESLRNEVKKNKPIASIKKSIKEKPEENTNQKKPEEKKKKRKFEEIDSHHEIICLDTPDAKKQQKSIDFCTFEGWDGILALVLAVEWG